MNTKFEFVDNGDKTSSIKVIKHAGALMDMRDIDSSKWVSKDGFCLSLGEYSYLPEKGTQEHEDFIQAVEDFKKTLK